MAIEKYVTQCFVIESYDQGEHDKAYKLFTREFGMLIAHAKSIRKLESKLRAHILPRSVSLVTLVQGREVWRLVGSEEQHNSAKGIHDITALLKRFIRGEGEHRVLYDRLFEFLKTESKYDQRMSRAMLYYLILVELGYADVKIIGAKTMKEYASWSIDDLYTHLILSYEQVRNHIQEVMKEMQL